MELFDWVAIAVPVTEVLLLTAALYGLFYSLRKSRSASVLFGFLLLWAVLKYPASLLHLEVINRVLETIGQSLIVILFVIFQPELRRLFAQLGSVFNSGSKARQGMVSEVVLATTHLACRKHGALIVFEGKVGLQNIVNDAKIVNADITADLLENIFYPGSPLHDGAVLIRGDRILAAGAILPLSHEVLPDSLGTRHRAALGISEESDAAVIVVSEETGHISVAYNGELKRSLSPGALRNLIYSILVLKDNDEIKEALILNGAEDSASR